MPVRSTYVGPRQLLRTAIVEQSCMLGNHPELSLSGFPIYSPGMCRHQYIILPLAVTMLRVKPKPLPGYGVLGGPSPGMIRDCFIHFLFMVVAASQDHGCQVTACTQVRNLVAETLQHMCTMEYCFYQTCVSTGSGFRWSGISNTPDMHTIYYHDAYVVCRCKEVDSNAATGCPSNTRLPTLSDVMRASCCTGVAFGRPSTWLDGLERWACE